MLLFHSLFESALWWEVCFSEARSGVLTEARAVMGG
ncbi:predicted protein [Plenodomus lingam JN3]|uniref:Predicted protein n=1 Tax=Leptosphaeria maculans (strain JN3 / isolate v23.1.3 / race Av1-4-5-6-7-8) TaxID=985895 RepID=E5A9W3_LEPMJ|nr:predicted protein [Plenodomus lingam JN3]CBY00454.1 predicted protein [Plenodomus lingam JN3]